MISHPSLPSRFYDTSDFIYIRFHGLGAQLYNYDYSLKELEPWAKKIRKLLPKKECYVFFNNTYSGQALKNIQILKEMLSISSSAALKRAAKFSDMSKVVYI